jgi:RNA polymerase sigma-70 factor (ECF subfamily)
VSTGTGTELRATDVSLIEKVVARDESALSALYDRYSGMVFSVVMRIVRDSQAAEEILQDVFHQLWRNASRFDAERGSLPGFLMVGARNRAISRMRRKGEGLQDELNENTVVLPYNLESSIAQKQLLGKVTGAMDSLPAPQRQAVELAYFEGLTHSEIATRTGEPLGTIKTRLRTAMETLKQSLNP